MKSGGLKRVVMALAALVGSFLAAPAAPAAEPDVVVTIKPIHSLVSQVMEGVGSPVLIVEGNASPHTFALKPSGARAIAKAQVFIRVSEHLEPFTRRLVEGLPRSVLLVTLADERLGVKLLDMRQTGVFEPHDHEHDREQEHGDLKDPHVWLDPENAKAIIGAVAGALSEKWPEKSEVFQANAERARRRIDALSAEIAEQVQGVQDKPFVVFHDAYQYFERRFGLPAAGAITISPDQQPSAKRLTEVRARIRELKAGCVFAEPSFQPKLLAAVTEGTGARTGTLDPEGQMLDPGPQLYDTLMRGLAHDLVACLNAPANR